MPALDDYLDQLGRELQAPPEERAEILCEIRSHLELAVLDMERNGGDKDARLTGALERFGQAEHIGRELRLVHGCATWPEIGLAALPLLLFSWLPNVLPVPVWIVPLILITVAVLAWRAHRPLWWWAWLGWVPFAFPDLIPNAPLDLLWVGIVYVLLLLVAQRRGWLEATLSIYPLPTAWAFQRVVLSALEIRVMGWDTLPLNPIGLVAVFAWMVLLARTLRTPSKMARIGKALQGQVAIFLLNALAIVAARLWPTYPYPYPYTLRYFFLTTLPYAIYHSLPFLLFFVLTSMPALVALAQTLIRRRPPSRPLTSS
ncbi:MAG: hypothetical protein AB8I69_17930 [Anaerolineae bacterium]|jgi:hypothetical protein